MGVPPGPLRRSKNDTKKDDFIDMIKNPRRRIAINKFRLGNHHLRIEQVDTREHFSFQV